MSFTGLIFNILLLIMTTAFVGVGAYLGYKRGITKSLVRLALIITAAIITFIIVFVVKYSFSDIKYFHINDVQTLENTVTAFSFFRTAAGAITAFIIYIPVFLIVYALLFIPYAFITKRLHELKFAFSPLASVGVGALSGAILLFFLVMPMSGALTLAHSVSDNIKPYQKGESKTAAAATIRIIHDVDFIYDNWLVNTTSALGGKSFVRSLSTGKTEGTTYCLYDEAIDMSSIIGDFVPVLSVRAKNIGDDEVNSMRAGIEKLSENKLLTELTSDMISSACKAWSEDKIFIETEQPSSENYQPLIKECCVIFSTSTPDTVIADLNTTADVTGVFAKYRVFYDLTEKNSGTVKTKFTDIIATKAGFIQELAVILNSNEHMKPLMKEIDKLGFHAVTCMLEGSGMDWNGTMQVIADAISGTAASSDRAGVLQNVLADTLQSGGIDVTEEMTQHLADTLIDRYGTQSEVSADEISVFFNSYKQDEMQ